MSRRIRAFEATRTSGCSDLAERLAEELRSNRQSGQPIVDEQQYPSGKVRVTVIWDEWDEFPLEDRTTVIMQAYEIAEGRDYRDRIALASGLTVLEAYSAGLLPFQIIPALRKGDPVTLDQCRAAMFEEGASLLLSPENPQLRFATMDEAEAARVRLSQRLPGSEPIWVITQDVGRVEEWAQR